MGVPEDRTSRRLLVAGGIYAALTIVYFACAARSTITQHTAFNHFAHLAKGWLSGQLSMVEPPPGYAMNNDFAQYQGKWFIVFPGFPALLLMPAVAVAATVEKVRDGQIFLWLAGIAPAALYLVFERLRDLGRSLLGSADAALLALLFGLGTTYFSIAEQGTVWFAAHVVGAALASLYLLASLEGAHPVLAGLLVGLGFWTRTPLLFSVPFFVYESLRTSTGEPHAARGLIRRLTLFGLPLTLLLGLAMAHNRARFGDPFEFGYRYLTVGWRGRIETWGLFSYHYLPRNLGVVFASLPFLNKTPSPDVARLQISIHGLALWATSPFFAYLLWPARRARGDVALWLTAAAVALPSLLYQNTGQIQFGYRFSTDFAPFLFALLAIGRPRLSNGFLAVAMVAVVINLFGALSFQRAGWERYYTFDRNVFQPD